MKQRLKRCLTIKPLITFGLLAFFIFSIDLSQSLAATYYVDQNHPQASDSNTGTETLPWATITKAAQVMVAGDTVLVKAGTYLNTTGTWTTPGILTANSGTPGNPITIKAFPGDQVIVKGSLGSYRRNYITIDGFEIQGNVFGGPIESGIKFHRCTGCVAQNNTIHGIRGNSGNNTDGIRLNYNENVIVRNNLIFDIANASLNGNDAGVKMYDNLNTILEHNEVYDVGLGLYDKQKGNGTIWRYNYVHDCRIGGIRNGSGTTLHQNARIHNNIVARCGNSENIRAREPNVNALIFNNTSLDGRTGVRLEAATSGTEIYNNISVGATGSGGSYAVSPPTAFYDYNLGFNSSDDSSGGTHSLVADPQFISSNPQRPEDFKLHPSSPARGAGRNGEDLGAYATGSEVIGITTDLSSSIPPASPTNLTVR